MAVTRRVPGAICLRTSTHLVPSENSKTEKPVMFPPGCDRLATNPWPSGSVTVRNTIGMERALAGGLWPKAWNGRPTRRVAVRPALLRVPEFGLRRHRPSDNRFGGCVHPSSRALEGFAEIWPRRSGHRHRFPQPPSARRHDGFVAIAARVP